MPRIVLLAPLIAVLAAGSAAPARPPVAAAALETRCGWLDNPTPANWWLTDREREWTFQTQGGPGAPGWDDVGYDPSQHQWVATNGGYGYGCACARMRVDRRRGVVLRVASISPRPLSACRADRGLPRR